MKKTTGLMTAVLALAIGSLSAQAEPIFLARQYTRCTTCHYSPTGGGLLTPYGRSLSREELSTTGKAHAAASGEAPQGGEQDFLFGALGDSLGPIKLGFDVRPSHLNIDSGPQIPTYTRDFFMNADLQAAYQRNGWTVYGEIGRQPLLPDAKIDSYEYWIGHQGQDGLGFRVGRFLPAYGIRLADHTAYTRQPLGLNSYDQLYALELSHTTDGHLFQVSVGPGRADSIIHDDGHQAFTATGRFQFDLSPRSAVVLSGLYGNSSRLDPRKGALGAAVGFAPLSRLSIWTEADAQFREGAGGAPAYVFLNETGVELYRGLWLKVSPQIRTDYGDTSGGFLRLAVDLDLFPRTHWNVDVAYYRDKSRLADTVTNVFLAQLHLYL
jgi:hypothetical protein